MPLSEAGIGLLKELDLFLSEVHIFAVLLFFQANKAFVFGSHVLLHPDVPYRTG